MDPRRRLLRSLLTRHLAGRLNTVEGDQSRIVDCLNDLGTPSREQHHQPLLARQEDRSDKADGLTAVREAASHLGNDRFQHGQLMFGDPHQLTLDEEETRRHCAGEPGPRLLVLPCLESFFHLGFHSGTVPD